MKPRHVVIRRRRTWGSTDAINGRESKTSRLVTAWTTSRGRAMTRACAEMRSSAMVVVCRVSCVLVWCGVVRRVVVPVPVRVLVLVLSCC